VTVPSSRTDVHLAYIEPLKLNAQESVWMIGDLVGVFYVHHLRQPVYSASHVL
jgi:hypothetical protein